MHRARVAQVRVASRTQCGTLASLMFKYEEGESPLGRGVHFTAREKAFLLHVRLRVMYLWTASDGKRMSKRDRPRLDAEFEDITGVDYSCISRFNAELKRNEGHLEEPGQGEKKNRGRRNPEKP